MSARPMGRLQSWARLGVGLLCVGILVALMLPTLLVLLPWRVGRIRVTNAFGTVMGRTVMALSGSRVTVIGLEHVRRGAPSIVAYNHTNILDAFTTIWLTAPYTVGVAKRELVYYPFYGQAWWLAGHLLLDRGRTERAKASMRRAGELVRDKGLSICLAPEGVRARDGRLRPFKKGVIHMALQTGLPIVPMVTIGAHDAWQQSRLRLHPRPIQIVFLPAIATADWREETMELHLAELRQVFVDALPPAQHGSSDRPSDGAETAENA